MQTTGLTQWTTTELFKDTTLKTWIQSFIFDRKAQNVAVKTVEFYELKLRIFYGFCLSQGVTSVLDITPVLIKKFLVYLDETNHNSGGIHAFYRAIKAFLLWFESEYEPENWKNPIRKVKSPKNPVILNDPVDINDVKSMIQVCDKDTFTGLRDRAMFLFLLDTGVRAFELLAIKIPDIDFLLGEATIRLGKGRKPRVVYFGSKTKKYIRAYLKTRKDYCPFLWITKHGDPLSYWGLKAAVKYRAGLAGVPTPKIHAFRRWFCLTCLRAGVNVYAIQEMMGHADLQVMKRYLKQTNEDIKLSHSKASPVDNQI